MRVILAGQKSFGKAVYERLLSDGHEVAGIWSPYVDGVGFEDMLDKLTRAAVRDHKLILPSHRGPKMTGMLEVDLFVAAHSHDFIGRESRAATRLGGIGYHPSLLPRHRGRDAVRWTVHMGDPIAGGSVYWLTDNVDGGPIAAQDWCHVPPFDESIVEDVHVSELWRDHLFPMGVELISRALNDMHRGYIVEIPQNELFATWEPSWERPPLHRPELPQIGSVPGFKHVTSKSSLPVRPSQTESMDWDPGVR